MTFLEYLQYFLLMVFRPRSLKTQEWKMLRLLNRDRKRHGLKPVCMQQDLRKVARKHSLDMAQKDYFDHVNMKAQSPGDRLRLSGVTDVVSGENLAKIGGYPNPTQHAEVGLMNSPGHRANILNTLYNTVGIGAIQNKKGVYYFTQNFAKREVVFNKSIPDKIRYSRHLIIKGQTFGKIHTILYQVAPVGRLNAMKQSVVKVTDKSFSFAITFPEPATYDVSMYVNSPGGSQFILVNKFLIRAYRGLFT
jgi:hypothetical protein